MESTATKASKSRVFLLGLDGATFTILNELVAQGIMPNLKRLIERGVSGTLRSTLPPQSATAWASMITGKNPGKHGIYDFLVPDPLTSELTFVGSHTIVGEKIWHTLGRYDKRVGVINLPIGYPPEKVRGFMISGAFSPKNAPTHSYPEELLGNVAEHIGGYVIDVPSQISFNRDEALIRKLVDDIKVSVEQRYRATTYLMDTQEWDFMFVVFTAFDRIQHVAFDYILEISESRASLREHILQCYSQIDAILGDLMGRLDEETSLMVISDHGFSSNRKKFRVNTWLWNQGFLRPDMITLIRRAIQRKMGNLLRRPKAPVSKDTDMRSFDAPIDWRRTNAYFVRHAQSGIHLHPSSLEGTHETLRDESRNRLRREIRDRLTQFRDPIDGTFMIENIYFSEDLHSGPFVRRAPDLLLQPQVGCFLVPSLLLKSRDPIFRETSPEGCHDPNGIFIGHGREFLKGRPVESLSIMDIAPSILYLMGVPVPNDMDGKVFLHALEEQFVEQNPVRYADPVSIAEDRRAEETYSPEDRNEIKERLRGLGYLE